MDFGHTCLFHKGFCTVCFGDKKKNAATLPHNAHRKHECLLKQNKRLSKRKWHPGRKWIWNDYTKDWDTYLPDH